ncbi:MAG: NAD+ synthase [Spirochaetes bacterium]|nr:NAD+ synthase [Spirochaetota bacterium]
MKIAIGQINPVIGDIEGNKNKIILYIKNAVNNRADIIIFPEMTVIGYPPMDLLCNKKLIEENLIAVNEIAKHSTEIGIICGFVDTDIKSSPSLFNAAAFMHGGAVISKHYKTLLPEYDVFDEARYFSPSKEQQTIKFKDKIIGITICEDIWNEIDYDSINFIEGRKYNTSPVKNLIKKKIDIMINISASPFIQGKNEIKWKMISGIAKNNSLPIVYVNQTGGNDSLIFDGKSFYVNEKGQFNFILKGFEEEMAIIDTRNNSAITPAEENIEDIRKALVLGLRDYVRKCGFKTAVLGLSGGIDSALTAAIAAEALGPGNVLGITMPSMYSSEGSINDSARLAKNLGIRIEQISISGIFNEYKTLLNNIFKGHKEDITEENIQARIRGNILMAISNKFGSLLLTTGNKSELAMGYCTLYGDMAGGLGVISDLPKTLVYKLANHFNSDGEIIPPASIQKAPSAELRENQKDEDSLPPYSILDIILEMHIEKLMSAGEIIKSGYDEQTVNFVLNAVNKSEYKRRQASPGLKVTSKAFGTGRRIPIAQRFKP